MKYKSMFPWLILDMILFILVNIILLSKLNPNFEILGYVTPLRLVIFGLAVYRAANIISNEFVTTPVRAYFVRDVERDGKIVTEPYEDGLRGAVGSLLYCPSCTGVWVATLFVYFYLFFPAEASIVALLLALSGIERFLAYSFGRIKKG
jgi:hypothetical protein